MTYDIPTSQTVKNVISWQARNINKHENVRDINADNNGKILSLVRVIYNSKGFTKPADRS